MASIGDVFAPDYVVPPGATVADLLEEHGMTQTELARRLGVSLKHVNQVVKGVASISAELALGLEKVFGVSAAFWLNRESLYQAEIARREEWRDLARKEEWARQFPVSELKRRGLIPADARGPALVGALLHFFGIATPRQWTDPRVAYRKSLKFESDPYALSAWLRAGELEANEIDCEPYDAEKFLDVLQVARSLTRDDPSEWHPRLVEACASAGVALAVVDVFPKARVNGATRWLTPTKALIQLSVRYRWEDIFWFTFFHEAGHVVLHRKRESFIEPERRRAGDVSGEWLRFEQEADRFASKTLIPQEYQRVLKTLRLGDVERFAKQLGIAPAIVVGRLQHERLLPFNTGNALRRRLIITDERD
jgi:HTH-type transcriptional regulator/antitoxin HigA